MTSTEILNVVSMVEQIIAVTLCRYVLLFKPKGHSIYHCIGRSLFHKDHTCIRWLGNNIYYVGYQLLSWCIVATCLIMATQFSKREIFIKPIAQAFVSPITWFAILLIIGGHFLWIRRKLREGGENKDFVKPV